MFSGAMGAVWRNQKFLLDIFIFLLNVPRTIHRLYCIIYSIVSFREVILFHFWFSKQIISDRKWVLTVGGNVKNRAINFLMMKQNTQLLLLVFPAQLQLNLISPNTHRKVEIISRKYIQPSLVYLGAKILNWVKPWTDKMIV